MIVAAAQRDRYGEGAERRAAGGEAGRFGSLEKDAEHEQAGEEEGAETASQKG
jgi:hypothetical protein